MKRNKNRLPKEPAQELVTTASAIAIAKVQKFGTAAKAIDQKNPDQNVAGTVAASAVQHSTTTTAISAVVVEQEKKKDNPNVVIAAAAGTATVTSASVIASAASC